MEAWPDKPTEDPKPSPFGGRGKKHLPYPDLMTALRREMRMLGVGRAIIQLHITEREVRRDDLPRRDARPSKPGVIISAEIPDVGWRSFFTDAYDLWLANFQALVRGFEMSRALERDGFARNKDQYRGFPQLEAAPGGRLEAEEVLLRHAGHGREYAQIVGWSRITRLAIRNTHPDKPDGSRAAYDEVMEAKALLGI